MDPRQPRTFVDNAADPRQVKRAKRKDRDRRNAELRDLNAVLATEEGRRLLMRFLNHCSVFQSIWDPSARIHLNAGRQDVGHFIMAEIEAANDEALFLMMREKKASAIRERLEDEAARTPHATTGDDEGVYGRVVRE